MTISALFKKINLLNNNLVLKIRSIKYRSQTNSVNFLIKETQNDK